MIVFSLVPLSATINVHKADLYGIASLTDQQLIECRFHGFLTFETFGCCYMTFVLQAFYRLTRVVYSKYRFLQLYFIRYQTPQLSRARQRKKAQRDLMITRRILFSVIALTLPGFPNAGFGIMTIINIRFSGSFHMYRIQWMGPAITVLTLSIVIVFINSQVKQILKKFKCVINQLTPIISPMRELRSPSILLPTPIQT
ncbi:unnamed protein product [Rotaria sp. Silwood2]|nr:unnamed protein product [Rotaria sp. Silwood2]CAF2834319.1 unnamed protein product [Rotaria sp. Silwood2]CAF3086428.1 unnamed protein product [Rotaria sp. Silwood2]CAF3192545.1 unnamed protein product [Rotaria sp. Silwood2]CAF4180552.1 unnamed protein product [Rotaria sp. Silwood2]